MSGRKSKALRRAARKEIDRRLDLAGGKLVTTPRWWFRVYLKWAKWRGYDQDRIRRVARRGIRREIVSQ